MKLYRAGATTISVSDGSISDEARLAVTVAPGAASKLVLSAASTTPTAGASDNLTMTAQDPYGNTATTYTGSHKLTFSGASASPSGEMPTVTNSSGTATAFGTATAIEFNAGVASVSGSSNGDDEALQERLRQPQCQRRLAYELDDRGHRRRRKLPRNSRSAPHRPRR